MRILSVLLIPVLALGLFSGCFSRCFVAKPDEPFKDVEFIDRFDYLYFPLYVDFEYGEVLGQALNEDYNMHELYYEVKGVDPDVMVYLYRGRGLAQTSGLFYNPEKIDLFLDAFQPSGMMLAVTRQVEGPESFRSYDYYVWFVTQAVWDAWKDAFHASPAEETNKNTREYRQKQLSLYQELEKRILVVEQSVIDDFCRELFLHTTKGEHYSPADYSWEENDEENTAWSINLKLQHYHKQGADLYLLARMNVKLQQNRKKEWIWDYDPVSEGMFNAPGYEISLGEGTEEYLFSLMREVTDRVKEGNTPDSDELFDFWSEYFPEDKLPPVFTFPGLGDLAPET